MSVQDYVAAVKAMSPDLRNSFYSRCINGGYRYVQTYFTDIGPWDKWLYASKGGSGYQGKSK